MPLKKGRSQKAISSNISKNAPIPPINKKGTLIILNINPIKLLILLFIFVLCCTSLSCLFLFQMQHDH